MEQKEFKGLTTTPGGLIQQPQIELLFLEALSLCGTTRTTHYLLFSAFSPSTVCDRIRYTSQSVLILMAEKVKYTLLRHQNICLNSYSSQRSFPKLRLCFTTSQWGEVVGKKLNLNFKL